MKPPAVPPDPGTAPQVSGKRPMRDADGPVSIVIGKGDKATTVTALLPANKIPKTKTPPGKPGRSDTARPWESTQSTIGTFGDDEEDGVNRDLQRTQKQNERSTSAERCESTGAAGVAAGEPPTGITDGNNRLVTHPGHREANAQEADEIEKNQQTAEETPVEPIHTWRLDNDELASMVCEHCRE